MLTDARDYLRKMREEQIRDGETAVRIWEEVLRDNAYKLGDECKSINIFHGCMVWIEKSGTRVTDRHHKACRVMPSSDPE